MNLIKKQCLLHTLFLLAISISLVGCSNKESIKPSAPTPTQTKAHWPNNINYSANQLEFANSKTLGSLAKKWKDPNSVISIAHFGDSHVQPGWQVGPLRDSLQAIRGNAGRGMIFPYSIAKTYSQEDYQSSFTGKWKTANSIQLIPKIPLGISGFVAKTSEKQAQINFRFKKSFASEHLNAKILFKVLNGSYELTLMSGQQRKTITVSSNSKTQTADFQLVEPNHNLTLTIQTNDDNAEFELHGIHLSNSNKSGVIYNNLGVGGAAYQALLQQKLFEEQFPILHADLVILDWGTNNIIYTNQIDEDLEWEIRQTIKKVREVNPNVAILLTSAQEATYKGHNITVSSKYAELIKRIAKEENTLFYDWYKISGGHGSINLWRSLGFASKDGIHLNAKGYRIRAKLLGDALIQTLEKSRNR